MEGVPLVADMSSMICSEKMKNLINKSAAQAEIKPIFVNIHDNNKASLVYQDGAVSSVFDFYDFAGNSDNYKEFLDLLEKKCLISLDLLSMFTLRSISTVYPWDKLLANQFLGQYLDASKTLTESDLKLLCDVRYGRFDALKVEEESKTAYKFLRLERKLFLQYPTEDD